MHLLSVVFLHRDGLFRLPFPYHVFASPRAPTFRVRFSIHFIDVFVFFPLSFPSSSGHFPPRGSCPRSFHFCFVAKRHHVSQSPMLLFHPINSTVPIASFTIVPIDAGWSLATRSTCFDVRSRRTRRTVDVNAHVACDGSSRDFHGGRRRTQNRETTTW